MNANELADYVDAREINNPHLKEAATMLRQQQSEIEALKADKDRITRDLIGASFYEHDYKTLLPKYEALEKQVAVWERSSKDRAIKLNISAIKISQQQAEIEALKELNTMLKDAIEKRIGMDAERYKWLRAEFAAGRETYIGEWIPSGEELDKYIDDNRTSESFDRTASHMAGEYVAHKELNNGGEPVKNATYWKRQYNEMSAANDRLKSGLYHANEQIKHLEAELRGIDELVTGKANEK